MSPPRKVALQLAVLSAIPTTVASQSGVNSTYFNPVLPGWHSDPSCVHVNDTYYCATSTFEVFPGLPIYASKDLINWRHISNAWNREEQLPGINLQTPDQQWGFFAPNLRFHDGLFYMTSVYAGINTTTMINGTIFTTVDPYDDNSWSVPFVWEVPDRTIDPDLFFDDDGTTYLTFSGIVQQTIDLRSETLSPLHSIWNGSSGVWAEGPHIYKKDGYYYLLAAEGGTQLGHMVTVARSKNISGPYESNPANPILTARNTTNLFQTVGHADLFEDGNGNWWGMALTTRSGPEYEVFPMGREAALFPVTWREGEWPVATQVKGKMNVWQLPQYSLDVPGQGAFVDEPDIVDFEPNSKIPGHFVYFRYPPDNAFQVSATGHLSSLQVTPSRVNLTGVQSSSDPELNGQAGLAFIGRRQTDSLFTFSVDVEFQPSKAGYEAGATMFFNQWQHLDVSIRRTNSNESALEIVQRSTNASSIETTTPLPDSWHDPIRLTIQAINTTHYGFSVAPVSDLDSLIVLHDVSAKLVSSTWGEQAGSGSAILVGVYATTNGQSSAGASDSAYFSRWRYQGKGQEVDFGTFV